jgi:hypothetical protein
MSTDASSPRYWSVVKYDLSDPQYTGAFNRWYNDIHVPELLERDGFEHGWRTQEAPDKPAKGAREQEYWAIYQLDTAERFRQFTAVPREPPKPRKQAAANQGFGKAMINWGRVFYRVAASAGDPPGDPGLWWREDVDGPADPAARATFESFIGDQYLPQALAVTGACRAWQLVGFPTDLQVGADAPAHYLHILEFAAEPDAEVTARLAVTPADWGGHVAAQRAAHFSRVLLDLAATDLAATAGEETG